MAVSAELISHIEEMFEAFGPVRVRRMFSGAGIFCDEVMIGLVHDGTIYLRVDGATVPAFAAEGSRPFGYNGKGRRVELPYWRLPERVIDEPDELAEWARLALEAARRSGSAKKAGKRRQPKRRPA